MTHTTDLNDVRYAAEALDDEWLSLTEVVERCLGNVTLANRLVGRFRDRLQPTMDELQRLADGEEFEALAKAAHRFKGEAGNVGARRLAQCAEQVEAAARMENSAAACFSVEKLADAGERFRSSVSTLCDLTPAANRMETN